MGLAAEELNGVFLKHFLTETLYVVPGETLLFDMPLPASEPEPAIIAHPAPVQNQLQLQSQTAEIPSATPAEPATVPPTFTVIGENQKGVIVLVTLDDAVFQNLPQLEFLRKILAAIGLGPQDVAFVNNVSGSIAQFEELQQKLKVNHIISFASRIDTQLPHDKFTLYNPVLVDQVPIIFSQSLAVLDKDPEQKKLLWNALRQVFL
ncbi:hypothetical protein ACMA1I_02885 [Pontibacter sp. 13R65]|uniref:hypothetical protein n=1 Tax=Pontibacter sp. 13R65 TaxID=3127458 RepID=UPI00301BF3D2